MGNQVIKTRNPLQMPGNIVFRPIEVKFAVSEGGEGHAKRNPYCKFKIGRHTGRTSTATVSELGPIKWSENVIIERYKDEPFAKMKLKDRSGLIGTTIGEAKIDLEYVLANTKVVQWYNVYNKEVIVAEVLLDIEYAPPM